YRFNPFDLTKIWPHSDYPLIEVGKLTLNENPENFFAQIDQASFAPSNLVPGIGVSPDKMLLARVFAYADAHRARLGANFEQLPVNQPAPEIAEKLNRYTFDGPMRYQHSGSKATYAANSAGRPYADYEGRVEDGWEADGEMVRAAYTLRPDDDDFAQAGVLVRDVMDDAARERLVANVSGLLLDGVTGDVLERAFWYWDSIDPEVGRSIRAAVATGSAPLAAPTPLTEK
ncbi:MAG: catalase, partial [Dermatophilaceae bacterium]